MTTPENKYQSLFRGSPKILGAVQQLNDSGQIDLDQLGEPFVLDVTPVPTGKRVVFLRNGVVENMIVNTRRPSDACVVSRSFDPTDGFVRPKFEKRRIDRAQDPRKERGMRSTINPAYLAAMNEILS